MGNRGDLTIPIKWEDTSQGGSEEDMSPSGANPFEDFIAAAGVYFQPESAPLDKTVYCSRDTSGNLLFKDQANTQKTLTDLVAGTGGLTAEQHKILRQGIHFIDDGPAEGFPSGAYKEITNPGVTPSAITWWESSSKLKKIVELSLTWSGITVTAEEWKIYDTDGSTVLATITDAISYSGIFETSRTRTIVIP